MSDDNREGNLKENHPSSSKEREVSGAKRCRRNQAQPMVRLNSVSVMSKVDQQRLEMLLDELIERRVKQLLQREGT